MRVIIDFIDTATEEQITAYLTASKATVEQVFDGLGKVYLVTCARTPKKNEIVESIVRDDKNPIQLLEKVEFEAYETHTSATADEDNWWKLAVISDVDYDGEHLTIQKLGTGTPVYLLDSGIVDHPEFEGKHITKLHTFADDFTDTVGHGTALASIIVGENCGITNAALKVVKIFEAGRETYLSDILSGMSASANDYLTDPTRPAVMNLSWGIPRNQYLDEKIASLMELGIIVVAAAGNSGVPVADVSPAAIPEVFTIGSFGQNLKPSDFTNYTGPSDTSLSHGETNYGAGLDLFCPGEAIRAAKIDGTLGYTNGTSAAAAIMTACAVASMARLTADYALMNQERVERNLRYWTNNSLLTLEGKYENSPNRVPAIKTVPYDGTTSRQKITFIVTKSGEPVSIRLADPTAYNSIEIGELPAGLTLKENFITGQLEDESFSDKGVKRVDISYKLTSGDIVEDHVFSLVIFDATRYNEQDTEDHKKVLVEVELYCSCPGGCSPGRGCCASSLNCCGYCDKSGCYDCPDCGTDCR